MTDYTWTGIVSTDSTVAGNWSPSGVPTTSDKAIFNASATQGCSFTISALDEIEITQDFAFLFSLGADVTLQGLSISKAGSIAAVGSFSFIFSGTPLYKSNTCYVENYISDSPFDNATSRQNIIYQISNSIGVVYLDCGIYPNVIDATTGSGSVSPEYVTPSVTDATQVKMLRLKTNNFLPNSSSPTANDRAKEFILEDAHANQFQTVAGGVFDGGYATWTFQAMTSGFVIPTSNNPQYNGLVLHFDKMIIDATADGAGAWAKITESTRLTLTNFTVNVGASVKGAGACAIHLINQPTIKGTWGFFPIANGIYHHKDGEIIGVGNGGTGLSSVAEGDILFGAAEQNKLQIDSGNFVYDTANELLEVGKIKSHIIIEVENNTGSAISKGQAVYVSGEGIHPAVSPAQADSASTMASIGLAIEQIGASASGYACVNGIITANSSIIDDTLSDPADVGKTLYVSPTTAGNLTITRPTSATHLVQNVGHIADITGSNVKIIVSNIGRTNDVPNTIDAVDGNFTGDVDITGKLTVGGLIDPTGLELTPQTSNPSNAYTLWVNSTDSNKLYYGASAVGGGGGGSGTVTSVGLSVPTGFTVSGSPITTSGTLGLAFDTGYALPTSAKQTQWDTAYGWGDHSTQGYLTSFTEADPIFTASAASGILVGDITNWNTAYGWGDHSTQGYLTSAPPETDPIFSASAASSITNAGSGDVSQGDTAFSWGDHSVAGYAPATPEVCVVNLANNVANFTPTGAYTLLQQTGNWASTNPNFNTATGLYTVASDGIYRISWQVSFRYTPVGQLQASRIFVNGSSAAQGPTTSSGAWPMGSGSVLLTLSTGDTVGLYVYISTTGTTLVGDTVVPFSNHMSINKVSD